MTHTCLSNKGFNISDISVLFFGTNPDSRGAGCWACAERGNMEGVLGLNIVKFFTGRKLTSSY